MSKRSCPFDESDQAIKKQIGLESKTRDIRSTSSERTLQLLYKGASRQFESQEEPKQKTEGHFQCFQCAMPLTVNTKCFYCEKFICSGCSNICTHCDEEFCNKCSFVLHDTCASVCYSCY